MRKRKRGLVQVGAVLGSESSAASAARGSGLLTGVLVPPVSGTVMLDSKQESENQGHQNTEHHQGGLYLSKPSGLTPETPITDPFQKFPLDGASVKSSGFVPPNQAGLGVNGASAEKMWSSAFGAKVNPMTGCDRTKYWGALKGHDEWDIHRGNSLISMRIFVSPQLDFIPNTPPDPLHPHFVGDFFFKLPDAEVFKGGIPYEELMNSYALKLKYILNNKAYCSDYGPHVGGWFRWSTVFGEFHALMGDQDCFDVTVSSDLRFEIRFELPEGVEGYTEQPNSSTFILFDHENSATNRGGWWSGFGYPNSLYDKTASSEGGGSRLEQLGLDSRRVKLPSNPTPHKTYPGDAWCLRNFPAGDWTSRGGVPVIPVGDYINLDFGNRSMTKASSDKAKLAVTAALGMSGGDTERRYLEGGGAFDFFGSPNFYPAQRRPLFKDSRYMMINSDEMSDDRKTLPLLAKTNKGSLGVTTMGVDFREFSGINESSGESWGRTWGEDQYEGVAYNPTLSLNPGGSHMKLDLTTYNEYGELLKPGSGGVMGGVGRNLLAGETFRMGWRGEVDHMYSTGPDTALSASPIFTLFAAPISYPTSLAIQAQTHLTNPKDLDYYVDDEARIGESDTVLHFFQNIKY